MNQQGHGTSAGHDDLHVVISASARANLSSNEGSVVSRLIHAVSVSQPVQSWAVIRDHGDFITLGNALSLVIGGVPSCPAAPEFDARDSSGDVENIMKVRDAAQNWLSTILLFPGARESPAVRQFLCYGANHVPPQYQGSNWISFNSAPEGGSSSQQQTNNHNNNDRGEAEELEMDDMFGYGDGPADSHDDEADDYDEDDDVVYFSATERYQPTEEAVTQDDVMEFQNNAYDVEMIEDVGSLAQSMGASHLGRSLQLQAELTSKSNNLRSVEVNQPQRGLNIGIKQLPEKTGITGGIGNAVQQAGVEAKVEGLSDSFCQKRPISAPRLDSFKMIKVVGKGSFGKVFLVREIQTSEMFALKVLRKDNIIKRNQVEHTRTERNVLGYVNHPFIVGLKMAFQSKNKLYFVLDYCAGGELFFHLSKVGRFPEPRAAFYAAEIVLALEYIHQLDIVYRDLKPENVLLDARGHVRLTDFGLSKEGISSSSSGANSFCGTPEYLAPEILNRQGHGRAVDWWSLGALLYEMLTGLPPFYCRDREKLFEKIRKGHLEYPRSLSARAQLLLRGLLTKDPRKRLGSGENDARPIKEHVFFSDNDWVKLYRGQTPPPWDPQINNSLDTSQFDEEFTSMPIFSPSSYQPQAGFGATAEDNVFEGFTFTDQRFYQPNDRN
mmetsp:Transcript_19289/g.23725  ORF Transcript_19289/g.23725 Transcript_19289/m.23725 type:complete len:666 (+) Transcript_19289:144-2141(+)